MQAEYAAYTLQHNPAKEEVRGIWLSLKISGILCVVLMSYCSHHYDTSHPQVQATQIYSAQTFLNIFIYNIPVFREKKLHTYL